MKKSLPQHRVEESPKMFSKSNHKNHLAQRLFDTPAMRGNSQKRPRVFSNNETNQNKLTPIIVREYQLKKQQKIESLPPIENNLRTTKMMTEESEVEYIENERIANIKKGWLEQQQDNKYSINQMKAKQAFNKTRVIESRMNRTLTESRHVIHLIDKMKGQFAVDKTKGNRVEHEREIKVEERMRYQQKQFQKVVKKEETRGKDRKEFQRSKNGILSLQNSKEIDLFIFMAQDGKIPDYQFYYMIKEESNDYYNMDIVTYQTVMRKKLTEYYTLSGHGVTKYEDSRPIEFLNLSDWDAERRQFNELKELQFFKKFRKWKTLKKWIGILSKQKLNRIRDILSESLFILNTEYRNILLVHHNICYDIQQFKCLYVPTEPLNIDNFRKQQEKKKNSLIFSLKQCSKEMHHNSSEGLRNVVQELKNQVMGGQQFDENDEKEGNLDEKIEAFVELGFASNISFGHRSTVRSQFMKFLRFAYLLDFVAIDSLGKMVLSSLQNYMTVLYGGKIAQSDLKKNKMFQQNQRSMTALTMPQGLQFGVTSNPQGKNVFIENNSHYFPILQLFLSYKQKDELNYKKQKTMFLNVMDSFLSFDIEGFVVTQTEKGFIYEEDSVLSVRKVENVCEEILVMSPTEDEINHNLIQCVTETLDALQIIEKWAKNDEFSQYVRALEEWDDIIGQKWQGSDQRYLSIGYWLKQQNNFRGFKGYVKNSVNATIIVVMKFIQQHDDLLSNFQRNIRSNIQILADDRMQDQAMAFEIVYDKIIQCQEFMNNFLLQKVDIYIYSVQMGQLRFVLIEKQRNLIKNLCSLYISLIQSRGTLLKEWLTKSIQELTGLIIRIEEFVTQKKDLDRINIEIPFKKEQISILGKLFKILQSSRFSNMLTKEDKEIVSQLTTLSSSLSLTLSDVQNHLPKYIERFKKQIRQTLEKFQKQSEELKETLSDDLFNKNYNRITEAAQSLNRLKLKIQFLQEYTRKHRMYEQVLEVTEYTNFKDFRDLKGGFLLKDKTFNGIIDLQRYTKEWNELKLMLMEIKEISSVCDKYMKDMISAERGIPQNQALPIFKRKLFIFKDVIPVITALKCPYLLDQDYRQIQLLLKTSISLKGNEQLSLQQFLSLPFQQVQEQIINISTTATQCFYLKRQLDNFQNEWISFEIKLKQFKETSDIIIIYEIEELTAKLDESMAIMSNLLSNRYISQLRDRAEKLYNEILMAQQIIEKLVQCQKKWVYLENIFSAQDIKKQLMIEAGYFQQADKFLKNLTKKASSKPLITRLIKNTNFIQLTKILQLLQQIQKKLQDYLQVKRRLFSRFYFISNDELVEILANSNNMNIIQKHVNKLFQGVATLNIQKETPGTIDGLISPEGQVIKINGISTRFNIETWLNNLQKEMAETMKKVIRDGNKDYFNVVQKTRIQWILNHKSQAVLTDNQIIWTNETQQAIKEQAVRRDSLNYWYELLVKQLHQVTQLIKTELKPLYHKIAVALITADVHNRDVILNLINSQIESIHDFGWQQQLKYYIEDNDSCTVRQVSSTMDYGYQYLGATTRLVITPLTDKCWITITSAIANYLGASPAGPAGTGKTESTKDLAKGLARVCIVFNCSDQITAQMMNKLFSGLAQQGAWTCLDEFNRIDIEVLSVIAQQLFSIRVGLKREKGQIQLQGKVLPIKRNFGVFITMNPGYAGRTQLPDNLKSLFRPVAMMIPDYAMIAQIMLFAQGFQNASQLSRKMIQLYKLASQQLSQQKHYDFGLRAVKSLLVMAGELKRHDTKSSQQVVLIKAMKESNIPKFLQNDIYLFEALVSDLFPSVIIQQTYNETLKAKTMMVINEMKLGNKESVTLKVLQLHEVVNIRFGLMIVGDAGVGKTTCYRILQSAMSKVVDEQQRSTKKYYKVQEKVVNPKSVSMGQLYGQIDLLSQQWYDGLLSSIMRQCNNDQKKSHFWITLDGPVDAMWIQNLNTVLDDNMTLCLANGQRIKLRSQLRMLFQVQNLEAASPATVSRCGMVYISSNNNYIAVIEKGVSQLNIQEDLQKHLLNTILTTISALMGVRQTWNQPIATIQLQIAECLLLLIKVILNRAKPTHSYEQNVKRLNIVSSWALIWAMGSAIQNSSYNEFQINLRAHIQNIFLPKTQTLFDFFVSPDTLLTFIGWQSKLQEFQYVKGIQYHNILVPTIDTLKYKYIFDILLEARKPILITGNSGVGKTSLAVPFLFSKRQSNVVTIFLNFSAKTKSKQTQLAIESKLNKKGKSLFGARPNETIAIFIDDINMPELEKEGAQPTIQLLRQFIDYQGFYDRQKLFWKQVVDTTIISCGATPSGGRNKLNTRFVRHHMVVCLPQPSESNLKKIFGSILKGFLNVYNFTQSVKKVSDGIISCTLDFYRTIRKEILPIPSKFHYLFNLRDISRVFQGILQCSVDNVTNSQKLLLLWAHELERVFGDRLNNEQDRIWFYNYASTVSKRYSEGVQIEKIQNRYFTKILTSETGEPSYEQIDDLKKTVDYLQNKIYEYNLQSSGKLELVFFKETVQHILRIYRVLSQPRGNSMLIGVGGSGKQSLSKLSSFIANCKISQLQFGKNYGIDSFKADLQKISIVAGAEETPLCFLFIDTQILYEQFLESINNLLNTGEVPNLFKKKEEIDDILNKVRPSAIRQKKTDSPEALWSFFIANIRANLHIILCMSPAGQALRVRARKFPSLIDCCTINWFDSWSQQSLLTVAQRTLQTMPLTQDQKKKYSQLCTYANLKNKELSKSYFINERRKVQSTPKTYLDQLALFNNILNMKNQEIDYNKKILTEGLEKLYLTNDIVIKLKIQMTKLQPKLEEQCVKTEQFLIRLGKEKEEANGVQEQVLAETFSANEQTLEIKVIKDEAQHQLGKALPMLLQAQEALKRINKNDITEIKGYVSPHPIVLMVLQAVCILLNQKTDWASIKTVLVDLAFLDRLKNFEKNSIPEQILKKLRNYTTRAQFEPQTVGQKNLASKSLCLWCRAIDNYAKVIKQVQPKKKKLNELQKVFQQKNKVLFMKQKQLQKIKDKVAKLQKECQQTLDFKNKLQGDLDLTSKRLQRAASLTNLLKDESLRWSTMIDGFKTLIVQTPGQSFLASIYLSYLGPFTGEYRQEIYSSLTDRMKENNLLYPQNFSLVTTLFDQITIRDWILEGLPNDPVSVENSIISKKGIRYPLMIDPQMQANKWLKVNEKNNKLAVVTFNSLNYLKVIETAVKCGYPVLIQDVEETLQSSIDGLLQKKIQVVEGLKMTVLGDKKITYDDRFYLYMTTRLGNPKFLAEIFNKSTVINFSITFNGLKDQLLSDVCKKQKPQIESQRDEIIVKVAQNKKFLKESQDKILKMLAESKGMVLDDIQLITTLQQSKVKSKEVQKSLQKNSIIQEQINIARSLYLPTAIRGTILYFVISKLSLIQSMYEFSLEYVKKLYNAGIEKSESNAMIELKLRRLNQSITKIMFTSISRSLFEVHKKLYAFLICCAIKRQNKTISQKEWSLFSKGAGIKPKGFKEILPNPIKITPENWYYLHKAIEIKGMDNLFNDLRGQTQPYLQFFGNQSVMNGQFPGKEVIITNNFHYLLLSRAFSPQNLIFHMSEFVQKQLGKYYDQSHITSIQEVLSGCVFNVPLLFVLSTGVDPTNNILNYCNAKSINLETISLGQGQGKKAQALITRAQNDGAWVLLNNCHLSKSWLPDLERTINLFSEESISNKNFRLLLSSMPVDYFPSNILQNADKITLEPPRGIKPNISKSFKQFNEETISSCPNRKKEWLQCLYSLTFFHALLQERRKYGPLGFNIRYQFNDSDLEMSLNTLKNFMNDGRQDINWDAIWYMIGHINYGGRVTDDLDRICLLSALKKCLNPDLLTINNPNEKFFYSESQDYYCLNCHTLEDFQLSIDRLLPNIDTPQIFGLHSNANISYIIQESSYAISCIQMIQPKESGKESKGDDLLQIISNIQQLPLPIKYLKLPDHLLGDNSKVLPSMTNFLIQQVDKFNIFLSVIDSSLKMLQNAIKGIVSMNSDLDEMAHALQNNNLPRIWLKYCYQTLKPLASWFIDFKLRFQFLQKCFEEPPTAYWISCFFFPQGLLTAFLQTHARKNKTPIDTLNFKFKLTEVEREKLLVPKQGGYIYGMHFEGAKYDTIRETLIDQEKGKINEPAPSILLLPVENYEIGQSQYNCPCYKTSKRSGVLSTTGQSTNFILGIHLNSKIQKFEYWTLKGAALVCQLNY